MGEGRRLQGRRSSTAFLNHPFRMRIKQLTRTAKSAKGKLALALFSALAVIGATSVLGAPKPSFNVAATPGTQTVTAGQNASYNVAISRQGQFTAPVALSASGLPANTTRTFTPTTVSSSGTSSSLMVKTNQGGTTPAGTYTLTITGSSGGTTRSTTARLVVASPTQPNFALMANPSNVVISDDDTASHQVGITRSGGFTAAVNLSVSGLPNKVSAAIGPNPASGNATTLTFTSHGRPRAGTYPVTVTGTGSGMTRSTSFSLTVEDKKQFDITADPVYGLVPGATVPLDLALTNPNNFALDVTDLSAFVDHVTSSAACDGADNFSVEQITAGAYPLSLPAGSTRTLSELGVASADRPSVSMTDSLTVNQDACKGATVYFNYSGTATK